MPAPKQMTVIYGGCHLNVYSIGYVAKALGRTTACIRRWEREGIIPRPILSLSSNRYRWFSDREVEALTRIFQIEHVRSGVRIPRNFTIALHAEFGAIKRELALLPN